MSSKIAILTDTHVGVRGASLPFLEQFRSWHLDQFWPRVKKEGITEVYHLGDLFDSRKQVPLLAFPVLYESFIRPAEELGVNVHVVLGNHDMYYREKPTPNSPSEVLRDTKCFKVYDKPTEVDRFLLVPFPTKETEAETLKAIQTTKKKIVFAHIDIKGFQVSAGIFSEHGFEPDVFKRFKLVGSGHYHRKQEMGNIIYFGSPYQMTWGDVGAGHGFYLLDNKDALTFIPNKETMFERVMVGQEAIPNCTGKYVRVVPSENTEIKVLSQLVAHIQAMNPVEIKVVDAKQDVSAKQINPDQIEIEDTRVLIDQYVDQLDNLTVGKTELKAVLGNFYDQAKQE